MSIQLQVFPQWWNGIVNPPTAPAPEMVTSPCYTKKDTANSDLTTGVGTTLVQNAINNVYSGMIPGQWYGFYAAGSGIAAGTSSPPIFPTVLDRGGSGVMQKISGLIVGATYEFKITGPVNFGLNLRLALYVNNTQLGAASAASPSSSTYTKDFTATSVNDTIIVVYNTDTTDYKTINCFSVKQKQTPSLINTSNGSVIVDLYDNEDIPLTFSADDFKNAAESVQSYSKAFNLPATKRNNKIFDNIFEVTRYVDGNSINFNPLRRTHATLKQDGIIIFEGFLRMLDVSEKDGEISYNVNIYSEVTALADSLKDRTFADLGFEELEHDYTWSNIRNSWNTSGSQITYTNSNTSGFRLSHRTLKYPFVDWNHQMPVDNGNYGTAGNPRLVNLEQAFRPWINIPYLISRIFQDSEFTYTSSVFDSNQWKYLYMDFNWGAETTGASPIRMDFCNRASSLNAHNIAQHPSWSTIRLSVANGGNTDLWNNSLYRFVSDVNNLAVDVEYKIVLTNKPLPNIDDWTTTMRVCKFNQLGVVLEVFDQQDVKIDRGDSGNISGSFSTVLQNNEYIALQATTYNSDNDIQESAVTPSFLNVTYSNEASQVYTLLDSARADINQWEFIKGLMTMFNLIAIPDPDDPNNIIFETYEEIFQKIDNGKTLSARNITKDWTEKIDESTIKSEILSDLAKNMVFRYAEDEDDAAFRIYKRDSAGFLYGSKEATEPDLNLLTGTEEIIAEPFAATVMKPLMPQYGELVTPSIYGLNDEGLTEGIDNLPRIMFNNDRIDFNSLTYYVPAQNGGSAVTAQDSYLQFSHTFHLSNPAPSSTSADLNFGICPLIPPTWTPTANNLFNLYWAPYYFELYNPNTKVVTLKIKLTGADIAAFKFNDHIMIKNRAYRCNKIDYKPNDLSTVELILLNFI
jgi:hypothetical protein